MSVSLAKLLCAAISSAEAAGCAIRTVAHKHDLQTRYKSADDPVTAADLQSQDIIFATFRTNWPDLAIVGEEKLDRVTAAPTNIDNSYVSENDIQEKFHTLSVRDLVIWIDPLDGTREFVDGLYEAVTVLVGISLRGHVIAGVIHQPFVGKSGRSVWGIADQGIKLPSIRIKCL